MGQFSPAAINIIVLAVALLLYGLVWYATRNMSRFAQVLARLSPVGLVIPAMVYVSALTTGMVGKEAAKPVQEPIVESSEGASSEVWRLAHLRRRLDLVVLSR